MNNAVYKTMEAMLSEGQGFLARGDYAAAEGCFLELVSQSNALDYEYDEWLRSLYSIYRFLDKKREQGLIGLYFHDLDQSEQLFRQEECLQELSCVLQLQKRWQEAAANYEICGMPVHATYCLEQRKDYVAASNGWNSLLQNSVIRDSPYEAALAMFNQWITMAKKHKLQTKEGSQGLVASATPSNEASAVSIERVRLETQRQIEVVAHGFEQLGQRERAFDCYQLLIKMGEEAGHFENIAEGYLNCIRVLKADNLKFYTIQYYEDCIERAQQRKEFRAAATLLGDVARYAQKVGLPYRKHYIQRAAQAWIHCGDHYANSTLTIEPARNAYLAAVRNYSSIGAHKDIYTTLEKLVALHVDESSVVQYTAMADRYKGKSNTKTVSAGFPEYLRQRHAYASIWHLDLLEWELAGDPFGVPLSIVGDLRYPNAIRRRALAILLQNSNKFTSTSSGIAKKVKEGEPTTETFVRLAEHLGELQSYAALKPLEVLFASPDSVVRAAAVRALRYLFFKRSFRTIRRGLIDNSEEVRMAAIECVRSLHFGHAFGPLTQIYVETTEEQVRLAALSSIGRIQSIESGEFLLQVLRHGDDPTVRMVEELLTNVHNEEFADMAMQQWQVETDPKVRAILQRIAHRGGPR